MFLKSGKAQIIAPEELDEDDGYAFNEVGPTPNCTNVWFLFSEFSKFHCCFFPLCLDGRSIPGYRVVKIPTRPYDSFHEIHLQPTAGP